MKIFVLTSAVTSYETFKTGSDEIPALDSCGGIDTDRIFGGVDAAKNSWPWILGRTLEDGTDFNFCGATVIDDEYVLTAKHCFDGLEAQSVEETRNVLKNEKFYLIFGDWKTSEEKGFKMEPIEIHFRPDRFTHDGKLDMTAADLAVIKIPSLSSNLPEDVNVQVACLPEADFTRGDYCWIGGWGYASYEGLANEEVPDVLQETGINLMSKEFCNDHSLLSVLQLDGYNADEAVATANYDIEFCGGNTDSNGDGLTDAGRDTCLGDSGGPLICSVDGKAVLTGVTSWGLQCGLTGAPGLYANVFNQVGWIKEIIENGHSTETTKPPPTTIPASEYLRRVFN